MLSIAATLIFTMSGAANDIKPNAAPSFEEILKIDLHAHVYEDIPEFVDMLRRVNGRIVNICYLGSKPEVLKSTERKVEALYQKYSSTLCFASTFDLTQRDKPDYVQQVTAWLDKSFRAGAVMTKIWKNVGMELKTPAGAYVMPDDPVFDPIYDHLAKCGKPLIAHLADPIDGWLPLDPNSAHYGYFSRHPESYLYGREGAPSYTQIIAARDNILFKHPDLIVIGAHLGSIEHDLDELGKRFDRFPSFHVDVAARTFQLQREPAEKVRNFFIKYQDRILYGTDLEGPEGKDAVSKEKQLAFVKYAEDQYRAHYQYYSGSGKMKVRDREIECLGLPGEVLEKFYHRNAERLMPALAAQP